MNTRFTPEQRGHQLTHLCGLVLAFLAMTVAVFYGLRALHIPEGTLLQQGVYTLGGALLLAGLSTAFFASLKKERDWYPSVWVCPLTAAGLSLCLFILAYTYLGVWPLGEKSIMLVDMHHQYAPLLSELRDRLLRGDMAAYSFHIGLGANVFPAFAYYLASPLNVLLMLFPEAHLTEGILVITLLKNALAAGAFAACAQYLYRRRDARVVALSVLYSMMLYMLAYSWNIMWLDVVALLPLVVLTMEHMLRTGRWLPYTLLLALALLANYYIGFMLCVFLVLYMLVWLLRRRRNLSGYLWGIGRFSLASLLAGGLTAALLIPTAIALGRTSAAGDAFPAFGSNFPLFDLVSRLFYGASPTIRSGNLPNLYCGVPVVLLVPLYFLQKQIPVRRRVCTGGLLAVLLLSCTISQWDLVWHGLHTPNDLPYRFSFLACFVMLLLAGYVLTQLERVTCRHILLSLAASAVYLVMWEKWGGDNAPSPALLYTNLLLLAIYAAILTVGATNRLPRRAVSLLLLTAVCAELLLGSASTLAIMDDNEYYTNHDSYVDNAATAATAAAVQRAQALADAEADTIGAFCRLEYLPRSTCMDTALHHYNGITTFASSNPYSTTLFMGDLGYAINGVNSYLYHSFVPVADSLMGIRYLILENKLTNHAQLQLVDTVTVQDTTRYIYRNQYALPLGYFADDDLALYHTSDYAPFLSQQQLVDCLAGEEKPLYTYLPFTATANSTVTGNSFHCPDYIENDTFTATVKQKGQYFAFVDCRAAENITVTTYDTEGSSQNNWTVTTYEPYIIDMGTLDAGQQAQVTIESKGSVSGNIYIVRLNENAMEQQLSKLAENSLQVTTAAPTHIQGTISAPRDGLLFLSIPYDTGWTVLVDGTPTQLVAVDNTDGDGAMLAAKLTAGTHTITLTYQAPGQALGLVISLVSLLCVIVLFMWRWIRRWVTPPNEIAEQV